MHIDNELGRAIAFLRGSRSQVEVSDRGRISASVWNLYEKGHRKPTEENLTRILKGLGCSRLQLEEKRWRLMRNRLLTDETANELASYTALRETGVTGEHNRKREETRRELRRLLAQLAPLVEELIILTITLRK